jgi:hypothetical protein
MRPSRSVSAKLLVTPLHEPHLYPLFLSAPTLLFLMSDPDLRPPDYNLLRESPLLPPLANIIEEAGGSLSTYVFENASVVFRATEIGADLDVRCLESGVEVVQDVLQFDPA